MITERLEPESLDRASGFTSLQREPEGARPKVAILTNYPHDGASFTGGVETATAGLLEGLMQHTEEFAFHVFTLSKDIAHRITEERNGMTFHFLAIPRAWYARPHLIPNILHARSELKKLQPDLIHCQDNMALALGAMSTQHGEKLFTVHGIKSVESRVWQGPEYWSHQMDALLERWVRRRFNEVITISPYVDRFLPARVRKHHITNPVRTLFFARPQTGVKSQRVLFVGALTRLKRPFDVIRALEIVRRSFAGATLSLVGQAEDELYLREMKRYMAEVNLSGIEFLGARPQEEVAALMRESTVLILASVQENTPMVIAEAMASGLPVIASNVGGVPMMVNDGVDGFLYECGNVDRLSLLISRILDDEILRESISLAGRQKAVATYSCDAVAAGIIQVYRAMLGMS